MTLIEAKVGDTIRIKDFLTPYCDVEQRICSMGLQRGETAIVISNTILSPLLLDIDGTKIAISRTEAKKIHIKKLN